MIPALSIFLLTSLDPIKNFVSLNTYISKNANAHCQQYDIDPHIINIVCFNIIEKTKDDFFAYLDTIGIEHTESGSYYFFKQKGSQNDT
jgi:hypothetical protein